MSACSDESPRSGPGTMTATLTSPNGAEGAAVVVLLEGGLEGFTAVGDVEMYAEVGAGSSRVVLVHPSGGDLAFRLAVPDTTQPPAWVIEQVAGPDDELRADVTRYTMEFAR